MANKILLVEDEQDLSTLLRFIFEKFGYEVIEAHNGQEALDLLGLGSTAGTLVPDVIVTDVMMPAVDGYTMVMEIQGNKSTKDIPVIVMTAKGQTKDLFQSSASISGFVEKPFEPKTLKELVEKVLKK